MVIWEFTMLMLWMLRLQRSLLPHMLSRPWTEHMSVCLHFDALSVGMGACGRQAIPRTGGDISPRQRGARTLLTILQQKAKVAPFHVHAHEGHPFNEMVDSLATAVRKGWNPPVMPQLRCGTLLSHPLAEWAWMEVCPSSHLPSLVDVIGSSVSQHAQLSFDPTLRPGEDIDGDTLNVGLMVASANVGTLDYRHGVGVDGISLKCRELTRQFDEQGYMIVGIQEARGRFHQTIVSDPYMRLVSAACHGYGGVELWLHRERFWKTFGRVLDVQQCCVWKCQPTLLAVQLTVGHMCFHCVVCYAPQAGRDAAVINEWWDDLHSTLSSAPSDAPFILLGDFNAKIGSVNESGIGPLAPDFENLAGGRLREICDHFNFIVPATWEDWHVGDHATFSGVRGGDSRVDFVVISGPLQNNIEDSFVDMTTDLMNGDVDHKPVGLKMMFRYTKCKDGGFRRKRKYDRDAARKNRVSNMFDLTATIPECAWEMDANDHWTLVRKSLSSACVRAFPLKKRTKRQVYFSDQLWNLVCDRKDARIHIREQQREINRSCLRALFNMWRGATENLTVQGLRDLCSQVSSQSYAFISSSVLWHLLLKFATALIIVSGRPKRVNGSLGFALDFNALWMAADLRPKVMLCR